MRFLSLIVAAICGAIGAACLMGSGSGPMSLGTSAPAAFLADFPDAEIGWGPLEESPFAIVDGPAPLREPEPGEALPVESDPGDDHLHVAREHGIPARLISSGAPKTTVGSRTNSGWVIIGHSAENRPLHIKTIGTGPQKTLIVAGIDGEDRIAVNWIDQWVQQLSQSPDTLRDYQLVFLRAANPDGLTARHLENARGIDLNRNFPTAMYRPGGNPSAGVAPASEPETRLMMQLLYDLKPQRVVHLVSHAGASEAVCNGVAEEASRSLADTAGVPVESFDPRRQAGSLEDFAATVLGIEVVTLRLRIGEDWRSAAVANYALCITAAVPQIHRGALASSGRSSATIRKPVASSDDPVSAAPTTRTRRMGYEELPPPPDKR